MIVGVRCMAVATSESSCPEIPFALWVVNIDTASQHHASLLKWRLSHALGCPPTQILRRARPERKFMQQRRHCNTQLHSPWGCASIDDSSLPYRLVADPIIHRSSAHATSIQSCDILRGQSNTSISFSDCFCLIKLCSRHPIHNRQGR